MAKTFMSRIAGKARSKSPWIMHFDAGGCNGCSIEVLACLTPKFDIERFGMLDTANPRHSDVLVVLGTVTAKNISALKRLHDQMPEPSVVVAVGACAITGGVFHDSYNFKGPLDKVVPVDVYVPGCPPKPEAIIQGIMKGVRIWKEKSSKS